MLMNEVTRAVDMAAEKIVEMMENMPGTHLLLNVRRLVPDGHPRQSGEIHQRHRQHIWRHDAQPNRF